MANNFSETTRPLPAPQVHYLYKWATLILFALVLVFGTLVFTGNARLNDTKKELDATREQLDNCRVLNFSPNFIKPEAI